MKPNIIASPYMAHKSKSNGELGRFSPAVSSLAVGLARVSLACAVFFFSFRLRYVILEIPIPGIYSDYTNVLAFLPDIFIILTLAFWLIDLIARPRKLTLHPLAVSIPLLGLLATSLVSVFFSEARQIAFYNFIRLMILAFLFLYLLNDFEYMNVLLIPLAASTAIQSIISIVQVLKQKSIGLYMLGEYHLDPAWSGISIVYAQGVRTLRAYGLSDHPNILGGCLAFSLILLASWQVLVKKRNDALDIAVILTGMIGLLLTFSRSAWLAFMAGMAAVCLVVLFTRRYHELSRVVYLGMAATIALIPFLIYFAPLLGVRLNQANAFHEVENEIQALEERAALNSAGNQIFVANALTGVGVGTSPIAMKAMHPVFPYYYQPPHNTLLAAAAETGIFGALFYGLLLITPWILIFIRRKRIRMDPTFISVTGVLLAITVVGFFDYYTWMLQPGRYWQFLVWGVWASAYRRSMAVEMV